MEIIALTGIASTDSIELNGNSGTQQIVATGTIATKGDTGATGPTGATGEPGTNGQGVPTGGTTGQQLAKINGTDYNTQWIDPVDISGKADTSTLTAHTSNTSNPHSVTKAQVGLGSVPNTDFTSSIAAKQDALVSGTNIKTINSTSILGSGDIVISGGGGGGTWGTLTGTLSDQTDLQTVLDAKFNTTELNELYAPQDRPKPPEIIRMIQSFDQSGHAWFNGGTSVSSNPADTDTEVGVHASVITGTTGTSTYSKYNFGTFDATNMNLVALVRVEDITAIAGIILRIGSDTNVNANYFDLNVSGGNVSSSILNTGEWVPVTFSWAKSVAVGSPNRSALKSLQFRVPAFNSKSTTVRFKSIGISEQRGPYCLISFDDNQVSANLALPYMNKYGFAGTMYSIAERIGTPNYQTMQDVLSMQNNFNWEIACHSYSIAAHDSTNGMVDLTLPQLDTELKQLKEWALTNKIRGADHFAWPKGRFNPDMLPVAQKYFVSAGMVSHYINQALPTFTPMRMARRGITATTTLADITAEITTAIANNTSIELLFHKIVPSGATGATEYNAADFAAVIDYIASTGIPVRTISEAVYGKKQPIDTDGTLSANSDTKLASQKATKTYADTKVAGPASSTDNAVARFDGTTGKLAQNSVVTIGDTGNITTTGTTITLNTKNIVSGSGNLTLTDFNSVQIASIRNDNGNLSTIGAVKVLEWSSNTSNPSARVTPTGASQKALVVKGLSSQTGNLQEWQDSSGTSLMSVSSAGALTTASDIEITDTTKGVILKSPDGTRWRVKIDNTGTLTTTSI